MKEVVMQSKFARLLLVIMLVVIGVEAGQRSAQAQSVLRLPNPIGAGDFTTADPALVSDYASGQITSETHYALVRGKEDNLNDIQPGMASAWEVSDDGLTITFTIRSGIPWVTWDGSAVVEAKDDAGNTLYVTAHDFEYGLKRTLDPATASEYAYVFTSVIKGAAEFNGSTETGDALNALRDAVGVEATDDTTLVVTLTQPASYAINILTLTNAAAQPQTAIEEHGAQWFEPGNSLSYGPYAISEWKHDTSLTLSKNPFWPGIENSPKPSIDQVVFTMLDEAATFNNYQAGTIDVAKVPLADLDRIRADEAFKPELSEAPVLNSAYYGFTVTKEPFDDVRVRRAFSLAIDREAIVENVIKSGVPARWFSRPGIAAAPTLESHPDLGIGYDPDAAKASLDEYLTEKGISVDQLPPITLLLYANDTVSKVAEVVQQMWQETLGVTVTIVSQEFSTYLQTVQNDPTGVYALGWTADYADANNFLREVFRSNSGNNFTHWKNDEYDQLVDQAADETDIAKRTELYAQAEEILVDTDAVIAPMYWGTRIFVTKPNISRTVSQINGDERLEKWSIQ
jgi:oligopeptide transport system substrate-binding protein